MMFISVNAFRNPKPLKPDVMTTLKPTASRLFTIILLDFKIIFSIRFSHISFIHSYLVPNITIIIIIIISSSSSMISITIVIYYYYHY